MFNNQGSILPLIEIGGGDSSRTRSLRNLPPGCRFYPSEEELLNHYLTGKNRSVSADRADMCSCDLIGELNLYDYEPSDLPEGACFVHGYRGRKRHWFCYTESKGGTSGRRRAKGGFWRKIGKVRDVLGGGNVLLGTRTKFVFYEVNSVKAAVRTPWIMYEYALLHHLKASFVLCRVFVKSRAANSVSENVFSSCAEESVSAVHHISTQHHVFLTPDSLEARINADDFTKELHDPIATRPVSVASFEFPSSIPPDLPDDLMGSRLTTNELLSIVEEDFIELEDLRQ
ncbi:protein CUP-SHAPED COTYLEDON 3-like [Durio zibethinus]|uniref:Protein CUP-SHAPED COTYLEDON 3-like n=1 Tax=Durio zibethinus TaxID=66656 RepID=A0A6P6B4V5_DURZI|nr:protein CUP-SHAPED COTYLEDON 3-like [Durio zibethinus]XP_022772203.1 protein CUP-SHAPED COTYLEDON 3-like [Durio zibethinus]